MIPTLFPGQIVIALSKSPHVGDVVIAIQNGREVVKRVAHIQPHSLMLSGDNQEQSTDSRTLGPVAMSAIRGVVIWPRFHHGE